MHWAVVTFNISEFLVGVAAQFVQQLMASGDPVDSSPDGMAPYPWAVRVDASAMFKNETRKVIVPHTSSVMQPLSQLKPCSDWLPCATFSLPAHAAYPMPRHPSLWNLGSSRALFCVASTAAGPLEVGTLGLLCFQQRVERKIFFSSISTRVTFNCCPGVVLQEFLCPIIPVESHSLLLMWPLLLKTTCPSCHGQGKVSCSSCHGCGTPKSCPTHIPSSKPLSLPSSTAATASASSLANGAEARREAVSVSLEYTRLSGSTCRENKLFEYVMDHGFGFPIKVFKSVKGQQLLLDEQPMVSPVVGFPAGIINEVSRNALNKHQAMFASTTPISGPALQDPSTATWSVIEQPSAEFPSTSWILRQRQTIELLYLTRVEYEWQGKFYSYYVYGNEHKVFTEDYPQKCCCTLIFQVYLANTRSYRITLYEWFKYKKPLCKFRLIFIFYRIAKERCITRKETLHCQLFWVFHGEEDQYTNSKEKYR
ncbi:hypothetical protein EYD10_04554 [Varanus komodoensis]|nr:hypothetical protein EYD10_04554 [Varanus komodoensis]